ncbi:MAG: FecR domain-containing protein [Pseudomonadota bacterium]
MDIDDISATGGLTQGITIRPDGTTELHGEGGIHSPQTNTVNIENSIVIDNAELLFTGEYSRVSDDLIIKTKGIDGAFEHMSLEGFFAGNDAALVAPNGAGLSYETILALAGPENPGVYATTGDAASGLIKIGEVLKLEGTASSKQQNGVEGELKVGDPVYQGDVVSTGADTKLGITFIDKTVFSMSENATMILDELVYKGPGDSENSMVMNLVQGTFVFVTGEIAPSGTMEVETPVATMGIRGTTPLRSHSGLCRSWGGGQS